MLNLKNTTLLLLAFLTLSPFVKAEELTPFVSPEMPKKSETFRVSYFLPAQECSSVASVKILWPKNWLLISESKNPKDGGCSLLFLLSAMNSGTATISKAEISFTNGATTMAESAKVSILGETNSAKPDSGSAEQWAKGLKRFLSGYLSEEASAGSDFSLESCRPSNQKIAELILKKIDSYTHTYSFRKDCDLDGTVTFRLGSPFPVSLRARNIGNLAKIEGNSTIDVRLDSSFQMVQDSKFEKGIARDSGGVTLAKFTVSHRRIMSPNIMKMKLDSIENSGVLSISEYQGKRTQVQIPLSFSEKKQ